MAMTALPPLPPALQAARAQLAQRWAALAPRERNGLSLALAALGLLLVWNLAVQPAWRTLQTAPAQRAALDAQVADMRALAAEARELRALPPVGPEQAEAALRAATERLGSGARLNLTGGRATVTLTQVDPTALGAWLAEVRSGARARVTDLQLGRSPAPAPNVGAGASAPAAGAAPGYSGTVVLLLGPAS